MITIVAALAATLSQSPAPITEVPFRIGENAIIVDVQVNGKQVSLMFDSGFGGAFVIGPHINLGEKTGKIGLQDFVGVFEADTVDVESVQFGSLKIDGDGMAIVQLPTMDYTLSYGTHVDGIMGMEALAPYVTEINFENSKFIIHPQSHDISKFLPDRNTTFLVKMLPIGHNSIEMEVKVANGKRMVLGLDTGNAFYATTHKDVLEDVGLWGDRDKPKFVGLSQIASGVVESWSVLLNDMEIFGVPVERSVWDIIDLPSSSAEHDGTVGFGFLKNFNITFDLKRRRVWLENFTGKVADDPPAHVGIAATYSRSKERMVIVSVMPNGPAGRAGVSKGDYLVSVGDLNLRRSSYRQVRAMLSGKEGSEIEIAVSRDGELHRFKLKRELLVNSARSRNGPSLRPASARSAGR
ncbi:MAG: PDZ domain-containing protein [Armatimonadetes bacterium]|nr:PDZ domain-containing protein [Armatimonadota bacterium]